VLLFAGQKPPTIIAEATTRRLFGEAMDQTINYDRGDF
jgi:hypothetical protein